MPEIVTPEKYTDAIYGGADVVPYAEGVFLIQTSMHGSGPKILMDSTTFPPGSKDPTVIGHFPGKYLALTPETSTAFMLPTNNTMAENPDVVSHLFKDEGFQVALLMGGEDPGPHFSGVALGEHTLIASYGSHNELRDEANKNLVLAAEKSNAFILGVCRGFEIYAVMNGAQLQEASPMHYPSMIAGEVAQTKPPVEHIVLKAPLFEPHSVQNLDILFANSHHHLELTVQSYEQSQLPQLGWKPFYLGPDHNIEILIRMNGSGLITGILTQGHPERQMGKDGALLQAWIQNSLVRFADVKSQKS